MDRQHSSRGTAARWITRSPRYFGIAFGLLLAGCASTPTYFSSVWRDRTYTGQAVEPVAVLALFKSEAENRNFEEQAVQRLKARGVDAVAGYTLLVPGRKYTQQQMQQHLKTANVGGVLIFRLIGEDKRHHYLNAGPYLGFLPPGVLWGDPSYWYYYPHWDYYWYWRSSLAVTGSPGYWTETRYYVIESSLYDNKNDKLLWTAKSETLDGTQFNNVADSVAKGVADKLVDLGLLKGNELAAAGKKRRRSHGQSAG